MKKKSFYLAVIWTGLCHSSCQPKLDSLDAANKEQRAAAATYAVTVNAGESGKFISSNVMGFNTVYCYEKDEWWGTNSTHVPERIKVLNPQSILRYPGGTVVSKFNWEDPTGQGWYEPGDPTYNAANDLPESDFMRFWEYLDNCNQTGATPLVGVNMNTGERYPNLRTSYHNKAIRLAEKLKAELGVLATKYVYLDNEPYMPKSIIQSATRYAELINTYAGIMKAVDPAIKFIVNTHPNFNTRASYTDTLIRLAGSNIDYVDVHYYWFWDDATWAKWIGQPIMARSGNPGGLAADRAAIKQIAASCGKPNIDMVVLEWNLGPETGSNEPALPPAERRTPTKIALMVSEQFMDVLNSEVKMACFWPVSWPWTYDVALLNAQSGYAPNKVYYAFDLYKPILKKYKVSTTSSTNRIRVVAAKSFDSKKLLICVINKTNTTGVSDVEFTLNNVTIKAGTNSVETLMYDITDNSSGPLNIQSRTAVITGNKIKIAMPQYSFARIAVSLQ